MSLSVTSIALSLRALPRPEEMSTWIQRQIASHQIAATAVLTGIAVAGTIVGAQAIRRKVAVEDLKSSIPDVDEEHHAERVHKSPTPLLASDKSS